MEIRSPVGSICPSMPNASSGKRALQHQPKPIKTSPRQGWGAKSELQVAAQSSISVQSDSLLRPSHLDHKVETGLSKMTSAHVQSNKSQSDNLAHKCNPLHLWAADFNFMILASRRRIPWVFFWNPRLPIAFFSSLPVAISQL